MTDTVQTTVRINVSVTGPTATRYEVARALDISDENYPTPHDILRAIRHVTSQLLTVLRDHNFDVKADELQ